jgi:hypothetical protein
MNRAVTMSKETSNGNGAIHSISRLRARSPELVKPGKTKAMIYGASGVGKTWFTLAFPTPYYMDCEGGADLQHYQQRLKEAKGSYLGPEDGTLDFDFILEQIQALATETHSYKTLVIDSVTKLYQTCIANEAERLGDKDAFGASKKPAIANMRRLVSWIMRLDMNVWFVAHEMNEWGIDPKTGQRAEIGKIADVWDKLIFELDLTLQAIKQGASRIAIIKKSRLTGFPDADRFSLEYTDFAERYGKDIIESSSVPIELATEAQVAEITRLVETVKVDPSDISKALTRASAETYSELNTDQADKLITWLKKKIS